MTVLKVFKNAAKRFTGNVMRWVGVVVVNYHRIGDGRISAFDRGVWSATAAEFERQIRWLRAHFDVISPHELPEVLRVRRGRHVLVTFDDGFRDSFTEAFPILRTHRIPATFFIATGFIDQPHLPWWDEIAWKVRVSQKSSITLPDYFDAPFEVGEGTREQVIRTLLAKYYELPVERATAFLDALTEATGSGNFFGGEGERLWMTWNMIREMLASGMTIGGHTVSHQILSRMPRETQRTEITNCGRRIEEELRIPMRTFSYPVGRIDSFTADTRDCLREAGVESAFSYYGGYRRLDAWDDYDIRRIGVTQNTTFDEFRSRILLPWWKGRTA